MASITLDGPASFAYEYKNAASNKVAKKAALDVDTNKNGNFSEWAQHDGRHITVACLSLRGAYHDASFYNVDAVAGDIRLISVEG